MLFNSYSFILVFLPVVLLVHAVLSRFTAGRYIVGWLTLTSLFFYTWWNPWNLPILLGSMVGNYLIAGLLSRTTEIAWRQRILFLGIVANLVLLGWYKYAGFAVDNLQHLGAEIHLPQIVLPIGISFFTFQQIAYLVDIHRRLPFERDPLRFTLFVTFFPHLIAGPITHHAEMMPQFGTQKWVELPNATYAGLSIFFVGLFKKVVIADGLARYADPIFAEAGSGTAISLIDAWIGAFGYAFQLYFDFSGYSDMAIGLAYCFGVRLPQNFASPYKAASIADFWRRWHMTLSRFLRDYLYIPLGGNRFGEPRRYLNLMIVMALGGLWHGAGWTFLLWGIMHGVLLAIEAAYGNFRRRSRFPAMPRPLAIAITFLAVVLAWVIFRAASFQAALEIWKGMAGVSGFAIPARYAAFADALKPWFDVPIAELITTDRSGALLTLTFAALVAWLLPNTQRIFSIVRPAMPDPRVDNDKKSIINLTWRFDIKSAIAVGVLAGMALMLTVRPAVFLYFQF